MPAEWWSPAWLWQQLLSERGRPIRFVIVGGGAALLQLLLLHELVKAGVWSLPANAVAIIISAEVNCALSIAFTWRDSRAWASGPRRLASTWLRFHLAISFGMALNLAVFAGARLFLPVTLAGAAGIVIAAGSNWLVNNRMTFGSVVPAQVLPGERAA